MIILSAGDSGVEIDSGVALGANKHNWYKLRKGPK